MTHGPQRRPGRFSSIGEIVDGRAAMSPQSIAVARGSSDLRYAELVTTADALAARLASAGIAAEHRVGIFLEPGAQVPAAMLGVWKAGAAFVPLDTKLPAERLAWICRDAGVRAVVADPEHPVLGAQLARIDRPIIAFDRALERPATPWPAILADQLAYIVYTSGSSGDAKGVMVSHGSLARHAAAITEHYHLESGDRVLQLAALGFDVSLEEILPTLCAGGTVVIAQPALSSFVELSRWLAAERVTVVNLPASLFHEWAAELERPGVQLPRCVRLVVVGSEPVHRAAWERWVTLNEHRARGINAYGATETTITATLCELPLAAADCTAADLTAAELTAAETLPIGQPLEHVRAYVLDDRLARVELGAPGTLHLAGECLARGYAGRPDLTADRFGPDPFSAQPGARLYNTGDRVRLGPQGLEFLGRVDRELKIRGHRVAPEEVEAALLAICGVTHAAVHASPRGLAAHVAVSPGGPERGALEAALRERLPGYMVPGRWAVLPSLPLTPSGKVDLAALPALEAPRCPIEPRTETERALVAIFEEVLDVAPLGTAESFFDLGGHSLSAVRILARIRDRLGVEISLGDLFRLQTPAELARRADELPRRAERGGPGARRSPRPERIPLSYPQEQIWLVEQLAPASVAYTAPTVFRIDGPLDVAALERAVDALVARHEVLRTTFTTVDGQPIQRIHPPTSLGIARTDLRALPAAERRAAADAHIRDELARPFDVERLPLVRLHAIQLDDARHLLCVVEHHLVHDGWSTNVLFFELFALYAAAVRGVPSPLTDEPLQFADFVLWYRAHAERAATEHLSYWTAQLAGAPPQIQLPTRPRPRQRRFRGAASRVQLPDALVAQLRERWHRAGITPFVGLLAAYVTVLARFSGQRDLCIGTGIANRRWPETEGMLGMIINTVVLRARLEDDPTYAALLARLTALTLDAATHQDVPFERVVEALQPERDSSRNPIFQVSFGLHDAPLPAFDLPDLHWAVLESPSNGAAKLDLGLIVIPRPEGDDGWTPDLGANGFTLNWEYDTDLFSEHTIRQMQDALVSVLRASLADPDLPVSRMPVLSAPSRTRILDELARSAAAIPDAVCVHEQFAQWAARAPDHPAVRCADQTWTYGDLHARVSRLARRLAAIGPTPEPIVGICVEDTRDQVVAALAVLHAGGAYLPMDPRLPAHRLRVMVDDARIAALIADDASLAGDIEFRGPVVRVDGAGPQAAVPADRVTSDRAAYVIYTSGSTGMPKGVVVTHGALRNVIAVMQQSAELTPDDTILQHMSFGFDAWGLETFSALCAGATLAVVSRQERAEPAALARALHAHRASWMATSPTLLGQIPEDDYPDLRTVAVGSEPVAPHMRAIARWSRGRRLLNCYGPTEATILATVAPYAEGVEPFPIGRPIAGTEVYVLDAALEPVPIHVIGELHLGGVGLARGYLRRPELTAAAFIPAPFGPAGARLYRTGDLVRWNERGELEFIGRTDHQVKLRGYRIELGEIEEVLVQHASIKAAVVVLRTAGDDGQLVAYVVGHGETPSIEELRGYLAQRLPAYMIPSAFVVLPALPLAATGKVDLAALPAPDTGSTSPREAVSGPVARTIAALWAELLGRPAESLALDDDFFELGGHSLKAFELRNRVRLRLGVELSVSALFEHATLRGMADEAERLLELGLPLSFAQQRFWFAEQLHPGGATFHVPVVLRFSGRLDPAALEQALRTVVERHDALRASFRLAEDGPAQHIASALPLELPIIDLTALAPGDREAVARQTLEAHSRRPFDLGRGPLLRACLVRSADRDHTLLVCMHHIVCDGWSVRLLVEELRGFYRTSGAQPPPELCQPPPAYGELVRWQREALRGAALDRLVQYWERQLAGAPATIALPLDRPRPESPTLAGALHELRVPAALADGLRALARREGATLFMVVLAAFNALLARYTDEHDLVVGTPVADRTRAELHGVIGCFVNTLVIRTDLSGDPSFRELLRRVRSVALEAYAHRELPFEQLVERIAPDRRSTHQPFVHVMFSLLGADLASALGAWPDLEVTSQALHTGGANFDLFLAVHDSDDGLYGLVEYSTDLFDAATIERLCASFVVLLAGLVAQPERRLSELPVVSERDRQTLAQWSRGAELPVEPGCVHELFERQAARHPDAIALAEGNRSITYRVLDETANQLAHHLRNRGVGVESRVALCLERSLEAVVAMLAVLKAGGAYVPLDPTHPLQRLASLVDDARVELVITTTALRARLPEASAEILCVDREAARLAAEPRTPLGVGVAPHNLAYIIYTSGSSGAPKGVALGHLGLANLCAAHNRELQVSPASRASQLANLAFDAASWELWPYLVAGAQVVIGPEDIVLSDGLKPWFAAAGITHAFVPTVVGEALLAGEWPESQLAWLLTGGEELRRPLARALPFHVVNNYGPTEVTVLCTSAAVPVGGALRPPIGRPIANMTARVLDAHLQEVPIGAPGELYVGGPGVARGYLDRAALTAEAFVPDPRGHGRLYRTRDRARWRVNGELEFLGRVDRQLKLRGNRIELGEIEAALLSHPVVQAAVAVLRESATGDRGIVGYVVPRPQVGVRRAELVGHLQARLPSTMIPSAIVVLDALPLTPNGKIDIAALPAPDEDPPDAREAVAPRTPLEAVLAAIWRDVLGVERVGVHDDFFSLGGHSLLATRVVARIRDILQIEVALRLTFAAPTIAELAARLVGDPGERTKIERIAGVWLELSALSEAELDHRLQQRGAAGEP